MLSSHFQVKPTVTHNPHTTADRYRPGSIMTSKFHAPLSLSVKQTAFSMLPCPLCWPRHVVFIGDSLVRYQYRALLYSLHYGQTTSKFTAESAKGELRVVLKPSGIPQGYKSFQVGHSSWHGVCFHHEGRVKCFSSSFACLDCLSAIQVV